MMMNAAALPVSAPGGALDTQQSAPLMKWAQIQYSVSGSRGGGGGWDERGACKCKRTLQKLAWKKKWNKCPFVFSRLCVFTQRLCKCAANGERAVEVAAHLQQFYGIRLVKMLSASIKHPPAPPPAQTSCDLYWAHAAVLSSLSFFFSKSKSKVYFCVSLWCVTICRWLSTRRLCHRGV